MEWTGPVVALVGAFMGFLYVSFSWRGKSSANAQFQDDPRVKGLLWGLSGAFLILIADWDKFLPSAVAGQGSAARAAMLGHYVLGFIVTSFASLVALSLRVALDASATERAFPGLFHDAGISPFVQFILYGYQDYQERVGKAVESFQKRKDEKVVSAETKELRVKLEQFSQSTAELQLALERRRQTALQMRELLHSSMDLHRGCLAGKVDRPAAAAGLLRSTIGVTAFFSGLNPNQINANYMTIEARSNLTQNQIDAARFTFGDKTRYKEYLSLRQYLRKGTPSIRLPVEPIDDHTWQDRTLPGAPEAFLRRSPVLCRARSTPFGKEVPEEVRQAQLLYFSTQPFDAILALPLTPELAAVRDVAPIGVLNIDLALNGLNESFQIDLEELEALLSPCTAMLAEIAAMEYVK